jgi:hypothetical protein
VHVSVINVADETDAHDPDIMSIVAAVGLGVVLL